MSVFKVSRVFYRLWTASQTSSGAQPPVATYLSQNPGLLEAFTVILADVTVAESGIQDIAEMVNVPKECLAFCAPQLVKYELLEALALQAPGLLSAELHS
jgi:hypothetical protein